MIRRPYTFDRVIRIFFTILIVVGCLYLITVLKNALLPFFVAWLLAFMIHPMVVFFQKKLHIRNRMLAIISTLFCIFGAFTLIGWAIIPSVVDEINKMGMIVQDFVSSSNQVPFLPDSIHAFIKENIDFQQLSNMINREDWVKLIEDGVAQVWSLITGSVNQIIYIISWFIVLLYLVFILLDYDKILSGFKNMISPKYQPFIFGLLHDLEVSMNRYFRGQTLIAFLVGILFSIGFLIIGLPLAIPLGLFIGLLNMVPYLQIVGLVPTILLCLLQAYETNSNFWILFLAAMAVFVVVQLIQDILLTPRIMGKVTGLNPAIILLSLSIWGTLMGIIGMIIALPVTTLMISYYQRYILNDEKIVKDTVGTVSSPENDADNKTDTDI